MRILFSLGFRIGQILPVFPDFSDLLIFAPRLCKSSFLFFFYFSLIKKFPKKKKIIKKKFSGWNFSKQKLPIESSIIIHWETLRETSLFLKYIKEEYLQNLSWFFELVNSSLTIDLSWFYIDQNSKLSFSLLFFCNFLKENFCERGGLDFSSRSKTRFQKIFFVF